jgi:hypothetical protein
MLNDCDKAARIWNTLPLQASSRRGCWNKTMTDFSSDKPRPSILRFTRTMAGPLRQQYQVDADDTSDDFTDLLEQADRRRASQERPQAD